MILFKKGYWYKFKIDKLKIYKSLYSWEESKNIILDGKWRKCNYFNLYMKVVGLDGIDNVLWKNKDYRFFIESYFNPDDRKLKLRKILSG